jgi:cytochrome d ubiquinol oxidase subunit I
LRALRANPQDSEAKATLQQHGDDLGYGLLLKRFTADPATATETQIQQAASSTIPRVWVLFFAFRLMVAIGFFQIALFALCFYYTSRKTYASKRWLLRACVLSIPLPWIGAELGWVVAEHGRQPWAIAEILPTALGVSSLSASQVMLSLTGFVVLYTVLLVVELFLMVRSVRRGPSILGTGRYHFETISPEVRHA